MSDALWVALLMAIIAASTPLLLAALGALVVEKSGILNLGVEGMMLLGAVAGFIVTFSTGEPIVGLMAAGLAGILAALLFGFLTLTLAAHQLATGLALSLFGIGLSSLLGDAFAGKTVSPLEPIFPEFLARHRVGQLIFGHDLLVYISFILIAAVFWFLSYTRAGLILRAIGDNPTSAHALGYQVVKTRYAALAFGGAMAGLAGSYYALVLTPIWAEQLTAGRGWIAIALVVFSGLKLGRLWVGAYLFGAAMTLELHAKAAGWHMLPPELLAATPYLATILALMLLSKRHALS